MRWGPIPPPQHACLARLCGRQSDCRTCRQTGAVVRDFLRHRPVGGAYSGGSARNWVQGRRPDDFGCGVVADHRLFGVGHPDAASSARSRDRPWPHWHHCFAGVRLCRRWVSRFRDECVRASLGRDIAGALVHGGATRAGGARITAFRIRTPLRGAGDAGSARLAACVPSPARGRAERDPQPTCSRIDGCRCDTARHRRRLRRRVAPRARAPWCFHPAGGCAAGLRRLLPAALSQSNPAQDPDRGRRQRPQRVERTHRTDARRERGRESGCPRRNVVTSPRSARTRQGICRSRRPTRDRARRAQRYYCPYSDLCGCHLPVHF